MMCVCMCVLPLMPHICVISCCLRRKCGVYLLILVGGDSGEHGLWEGESVGAFPNRDGSDWG